MTREWRLRQWYAPGRQLNRMARLCVARALYSRLLEILTRQGFHSAYAGITRPKENSVGLHEAMGFQLVCTYPRRRLQIGHWWDISWSRRPLSGGSPSADQCSAPTCRTVLGVPTGSTSAPPSGCGWRGAVVVGHDGR